MSSRAHYLLRLDDACPTMRTDVWNSLESLLDELDIKPIVGVIPDNLDPKMIISPADPNFWVRMVQWKAKGWELALHGLHHLYHPIPSSGEPILDLADQSEFVGLPFDVQKQILAKGYAIMANAGVEPRMFMAPSHTFDMITLQALREATPIRFITDGHALSPFVSDGFTWLPQQLWRYYDMPFGIWCICLHPNSMDKTELMRIENDLCRNADRFIDANAALEMARPRMALDRAFAGLYQIALKMKRAKHRVGR